MQKTAYEMRISDWSSDVCSSDLKFNSTFIEICFFDIKSARRQPSNPGRPSRKLLVRRANGKIRKPLACANGGCRRRRALSRFLTGKRRYIARASHPARTIAPPSRSDEHTSELQSLMRHSYAAFCLKK